MCNICRLISLPIGLRLVSAAITSTSVEVQDEETHSVKSKSDAQTLNESLRHSGVPHLTVDSSRKSSKDPIHQAVVSGVMNNPAVMLGLGLTTVALLGMIRKSYTGDRIAAQRFMQYRIIAQFFTLMSLIAGVSYFTFKFEKEEKEEKEREKNAKHV